MKLGSVPNEQIFARTDTSRDVAATVKTIIEDVKTRGDKALFEYTAKFDGAVLSSLEVSPEEFEEAWLECGAEFTGILEGAAENIRIFHSLQKREGFKTVNAHGAVVGQKIVPVE